MATVRNLVTNALQELGAVSEGEVPSAIEETDALNALNRLIDSWGAERLQFFSSARTVWTITTLVSNYAVGVGATVNTARPPGSDYIIQLGFQDTSVNPAVEYPLQALTDDLYAAIPMKTQQSTYPSAAWYNPTYPTGTIVLWPVPTSTTLQGVIYTPQPVGQYTSLDTTVALPPGYERMIVKNLALELAPSYEKQITEIQAVQARESVAVVKRSNKRICDLSIDPAALQGNRGWWGRYSIYIG